MQNGLFRRLIMMTNEDGGNDECFTRPDPRAGGVFREGLSGFGGSEQAGLLQQLPDRVGHLGATPNPVLHAILLDRKIFRIGQRIILAQHL
jgi:hypothetical protein